MKKFTLFICILFLAACSTTQNTEGKLLDASSSYCRDIRIENPELYFETCESSSGWKARDPKGYAKAHEPRSFSESLVDEAVEKAAEETVRGIFNAIE